MYERHNLMGKLHFLQRFHFARRAERRLKPTGGSSLASIGPSYLMNGFGLELVGFSLGLAGFSPELAGFSQRIAGFSPELAG
jgi:hypothetical protein